MSFINKLKKFKKIYLIIITSVLFLNTFLILKIHAVSFEIAEIEISEQFDLNFNKKKVFDKAFKAAFEQLYMMTTVSTYKEKLNKTSLQRIKGLIDSFNISDEKFIDDKYYAKFNVDFDKKKTLKFFEDNNIFPSLPKKIKILLLLILIDLKDEKLMIFDENPIFNNWNKYSKKSDLLNYILPNEDLEDRSFIKSNLDSLEDYDFEEIIRKYALENHIVTIAYKDKENLKVLSKIKLKNNYKIINSNYSNVNLENKDLIKNFIYELKKVYEDNWKELNIINTSIKLPITISLSSQNINKIELFEDLINDLDLVSNYYILSFNSKKIYYKVVYNGQPKKLLNEITNYGLEVENENNNWNIK